MSPTTVALHWHAARGHLPRLPAGQISEIECDLLYSMASANWKGLGEIVEIGALFGKSTTCLAAGVRDHRCPHKTGRIHVFDRWMADEETRYMLEHLEPDFQGSFRPIFDEYMRPFSSYLTIHEGDVRFLPWSGRPIEILFIDCSLSWEFHEMLFRKFCRSLIPGMSFLIHQDYFYHRSYYLPPMMRRLKPYFRRLVQADTSMSYGLVAPIPDRLFEGPLFASESELVEELAVCIRNVGGLGTIAGGIYGAMLVYYRKSRGHQESARRLAAEIRAVNDAEAVLVNLKEAEA